jgi:hypothetical protein
MNLVYTEVANEPRGHLAVESLNARPDRTYTASHGFEPTELNNGRLGTVSRPAREVANLRLPGVSISAAEVVVENDNWRHRLALSFPPGSHRIQLTVPEEVVVKTALVNGVLAFDASGATERKPRSQTLSLVYPPGGGAAIDIVTATPDAFRLAVTTWYDLPKELIAPFVGDWPDDARPFAYGPRAEKIQYFDLSAVTEEPERGGGEPSRVLFRP